MGKKKKKKPRMHRLFDFVPWFLASQPTSRGSRLGNLLPLPDADYKFVPAIYHYGGDCGYQDAGAEAADWNITLVGGRVCVVSGTAHK